MLLDKGPLGGLLGLELGADLLRQSRFEADVADAEGIETDALLREGDPHGLLGIGADQLTFQRIGLLGGVAGVDVTDARTGVRTHDPVADADHGSDLLEEVGGPRRIDGVPHRDVEIETPAFRRQHGHLVGDGSIALGGVFGHERFLESGGERRYLGPWEGEMHARVERTADFAQRHRDAHIGGGDDPHARPHNERNTDQDRNRGELPDRELLETTLDRDLRVAVEEEADPDNDQDDSENEDCHKCLKHALFSALVPHLRVKTVRNRRCTSRAT